jgi:MoxR-like ATPase
MSPHVAPSVQKSSDAIKLAVASAARGLVEREALLELIVLAAVAREHVLVIGPPGTAKSQAVRRITTALGGSYFEYLLGRFTEPTEIFGPIDLRKLREGSVVTETRGMLPEAEIAFLDEVFLGSTAILNSLLGILNERRFRRGHSAVDCPLRVCVGASNALPDDDQLAAFADRFLVRVFVDSMPDPRLEELLEQGWGLAAVTSHGHASLSDLDTLAESAKHADLSEIRPRLAHAVRLLRKAGIALSDRRVVKTQSLIAAAAALAGRSTPTNADLWPIVAAVPTRESQLQAREALAELLAETESPALASAALEASAGPRARATLLADAGRALLTDRPSLDDADATERWRLRIEGIARSIDAGFSADAVPAPLARVRDEIVAALGTA